jgi:hypothetical protein
MIDLRVAAARALVGAGSADNCEGLGRPIPEDARDRDRAVAQLEHELNQSRASSLALSVSATAPEPR